MAEVQHGAGFRDALIFLAMAGVIVPVFHRLKVSPVIGFLLGGLCLGPHGLARFADQVPWLGYVTITDIASVLPLAELGVVFLLFTIGLELSFERLKLMHRLVFGLGTAQLIVTATVLVGIAWSLGLPMVAAIIIAFALSLSSTAIVLPVMAERKRLTTTAGRTSFAILILQDLAVAPILITITAMANPSGGSAVLSFSKAFASGIAVIAVLVIGGRLLLRPLMKLVARSGSQELFLAACLLIAMGSGLIASAAGHSMALGAFLAGLLLAETEYRHEIEVTIGPFKGLLLGLFFTTAGAQLDLVALVQEPALLLGLALGLIVVKTILLLALLRAFRIAASAHAEVALSLAPAGELGLVLIAAGGAMGVIRPEIAALASILVLLTMFVTPFLHSAGMRISQRQRVEALPNEARRPEQGMGEGKVILVGFGRVGQVVADMLKRNRIAYIAVDVEPAVIANARKAGVDALFGDASRREFLQRIGIAQARALVATSSDPDAVERLVHVARAERPDLIIIARARDADHAAKLYALGASDVVPETVEASLQLAENVLVDIGVPMGLVIASVHERRDEFRAALQKSGATPRPSRLARRPGLRRDAPEPKDGDADEAGR
ncbi:MAG: cation:proton antiporter [Beijerinckiaceae bacterium]|nr:cation:proton antiporter [Beijerinckiaceae bacterium]